MSPNYQDYMEKVIALQTKFYIEEKDPKAQRNAIKIQTHLWNQMINIKS